MTSVAKLKDKARDFERKEDWNKAVDAYLQVIQATEKGDGEVELALYNRVGDLYLRLGRPSDAVDYYAKAADHYGEAGLYNNAIALCNKALRYQPDRVELYRKLGKLSAEQGFITDARRWYLEYAEKLAKQGRKEEAFDALKEFASLSEDPEIREMLAAQLQARGETAEAVTQLRLAWTQYANTGAGAKAEEVRQRVVELDPRLDGTDLTLTVDGAAAGKPADLPGISYIDKPTAAPAEPETIGVDEGYGFGEPAAAEGEEAEEAPEPLPGLDEVPGPEDVEATTLAGLESTDLGADAHEVLAADLPTIEVESASLAEEEEDTGESFELPTFGDEAAPEEDTIEGEPLPGLEGFGEEPLEEAEAEADEGVGMELPMLEEDIGLEPAEFDASAAGELPGLDVELEAEEEAEPPETEAAFGELPQQDFGELPAEGDVELEPQAAPDVGLPSLDAGVVEEEPADEEVAEVVLDTDEWGDFPGEEDEVASAGAALDEAAFEEDVSAAVAGIEEAIVPAAPPVELPGAYEEPLEEEPAAAPLAEHEEVVPAGAGELDVDQLIASARARFAAGERREALASLEAQHANLADANRVADAYQVAEALVSMDPDTIASHQARVEYAFRLDDRARLVSAYLDFAACLERSGASAKAESVFHRVLEIDPQNPIARAAVEKTDEAAAAAAAPAGDDFVDLGGLLFGEEEEETTRFVVAETVESGDEERDFADMLSQFRAKIAQHVPQEDTESHYDLGIAFKEMGLIDEAISEFQTALRGGNERLKIYEELGQCFMLKEQYNIAAKLLARGAQLPASDDAELLGVYYQLGRCYEELGQKADAREAYERVLGLDINFRDVNERLARL